MTLMIGLHHFFLEMSKKCWPRFRVRNSTAIRFPCFKAYFLEVTVGCKKNGNCQNKIDTFLQYFHSVKLSYERWLELTSKFNDIF
jgi:hypothetical protein